MFGSLDGGERGCVGAGVSPRTVVGKVLGTGKSRWRGMNERVVMEGVITAESKKGCGTKDVTGGGIILKLVEMIKNNMLEVEAGRERY